MSSWASVTIVETDILEPSLCLCIQDSLAAMHHSFQHPYIVGLMSVAGDKLASQPVRFSDSRKSAFPPADDYIPLPEAT